MIEPASAPSRASRAYGALLHPVSRRGLAVAALLLGVVVVLLLPKHPVDLEVYRRGGEAVLSGRDAVYTNAYGDLPFTYPPFAAILFVVLAVFPFGVTVPLLVVASLAALHVVVRRCLPQLRATSVGVQLAVLAALCLEPVWATLSFGQVNLFLAALVTYDLLPPTARRWSGALVGIAAGIKLTPAIFLLVLLARRDWGGLVRAVGAGLATVAVGFAILPHSSLTFWTSTVRDVSRVGAIAFAANQSLTGATWRLVGPGGDPVATTAASVVVVLVLVVALARMGRLRRPDDALTALVLAAVAGLLVSPISWNHHWVYVIPVVALLLRRGLTVERGRLAARRKGALVLAGLWLFACYSRIIWWAPAHDDREYGVGLAGKLSTSSYTWLGIVTLVVLAWSVWRESAGAGGSGGVGGGGGGRGRGRGGCGDLADQWRDVVGPVELDERARG